MDLVEAGALNEGDVYFAETSYKMAQRHPISGIQTDAVFRRDVEHLIGPYANWTWHWGSTNAGLFVGSRFSGTGLHVDQVLWSDVGRNFRGYPL